MTHDGPARPSITMHLPSLPGLLVALIVRLLLFGTKRLPEIGASVGQGIREFKKSLDEMGDAGNIESAAPGPSAPAVRQSIDPIASARPEPRRLAAPTTSETEG
jgi:sec-independent protein translocase protein TatA